MNRDDFIEYFPQGRDEQSIFTPLGNIVYIRFDNDKLVLKVWELGSVWQMQRRITEDEIHPMDAMRLKRVLETQPTPGD